MKALNLDKIQAYLEAVAPKACPHCSGSGQQINLAWAAHNLEVAEWEAKGKKGAAPKIGDRAKLGEYVPCLLHGIWHENSKKLGWAWPLIDLARQGQQSPTQPREVQADQALVPLQPKCDSEDQMIRQVKVLAEGHNALLPPTPDQDQWAENNRLRIEIEGYRSACAALANERDHWYGIANRLKSQSQENPTQKAITMSDLTTAQLLDALKGRDFHKEIDAIQSEIAQHEMAIDILKAKIRQIYALDKFLANPQAAVQKVAPIGLAEFAASLGRSRTGRIYWSREQKLQLLALVAEHGHTTVGRVLEITPGALNQVLVKARKEV